MEGKKFLTLFPRIENNHLIKDVGMIPFCMQKYYGYSSEVVVYKNLNYDFLNKDLKEIKYKFFPFKKFNSNINTMFFLIKNSKKIDILHLFHITQRSTIISIFTYFLFNKKGLIYCHMDYDFTGNNNNDLLNCNGKGIKKVVKRWIYKKLIFTNHNVDRILFGVQNKPGLEILKNKYPFKNVQYIADGFENTVGDIERVKKENTILFVGRVGAKQKRIDLLLNAFEKCASEIPDWNLKIIGPLDDFIFENLNENIRELIEQKRIIFTGTISDRKTLYNEYNKAKIFCLPSDWESFGLVTLEALYFGCYIVASDLESTKEIVDNQYGDLFKVGDYSDLQKKLVKACKNNDLLLNAFENGKSYVDSKYSYKKTLSSLNEWILERCDNDAK